MSSKRQNIRESFLTAMFSLLGYVASCDGKMNSDEVKRIKLYMKKMDLSNEERQKALLAIKSGAYPGFNVAHMINIFRESITPKLTQIILVYLVGIAKADGFLVEKELHAIQWIARKLRYKSITFYHLLKMVYAQDKLAASLQPAKLKPEQMAGINADINESATSFSYRNGNAFNTAQNYKNQDLENAYDLLGANSGMTDGEIRRNYKKLVGQFHPDKLANQCLSPDQLHAATEDFKKIQAAYSFIKKYRSIYTAN